jgi:hypothetical protein
MWRRRWSLKKKKIEKVEQVEWDRPPPSPLPWGPAYDGAGSFLSDGMEWNWRGCGFDFAFLHWTLGFRQPLHQSGNQKPACPNDDDSLWELRLREILQNTSSCPGTCALWKWAVPANQSIVDVQPTWMCRLLQSGQLLNPHAKMRRIVALWWISRNFDQLCMTYQCGRFTKFLGCTCHVFLEWAVAMN